MSELLNVQTFKQMDSTQLCLTQLETVHPHKGCCKHRVSVQTMSEGSPVPHMNTAADVRDSAVSGETRLGAFLWR